MHGVAV